jgi:hypothetical protein
MIMNTFIESVNVIIILYMIPLFIMRHIVQTYKVAIMMAILFGASGLIIANVGPFASAATTNQTGSNMTNTAGGGGDQETPSKQLDLAIKALDSGDDTAAEGYMKEADKSLSAGQAKMHLGEAMKALQAGDIQGAKMHAQVAQGML